MPTPQPTPSPKVTPSPTPKPTPEETRKDEPEETPIEQASTGATQAQCSQAYSAAYQCCSNPASCVTGYVASAAKGDGSITSSCDQNHDLGNDAGNSATDAAVACIQKYSSCDSTCTSAGRSDWASSCRGLASYANQYSAQGSSNYKVAQQGLECVTNSSSSPSGSGGGAPRGSGLRPSTTSASMDNACAMNPSSPGCVRAAGASADSSAGFSAAAAKEKDSIYNVGDRTGFTADGFAGGRAGEASSPPKVGSVANNTGGGIPGSAGSPGAAGAPGARIPLASATGLADIDQGVRAGGYSAPSVIGDAPESGPGANGLARALASKKDGSGFDLKDYLPGGKLSADRFQAAALALRKLGINPPHVDLWSRISDKFQEKCRLGMLYDCR